MEYTNYIKYFFWIACVLYLSICAYFGLSILLNAIVLYLLIYKIIEIGLSKFILDKEKLTNLKLVAISCLISFIIAEIAFRNLTLKYSTYIEKLGYITYVSPYNPRSYIWQKYVGDKPEGKLHIRLQNSKSYPKSKEFKYLHSYNHLGLRGLAPKVNDSTSLLITLGDSFTEGFGTSSDSTWSYLLTQYLSAKNNQIKLLNAGIGGSDVFYEYYKLKNYLLPIYQPNEVIIAVNSSDILDTTLKGGMERFSNGKRKNIAPWWEPFYGISYLFRALAHDVFGVKWHLLSKEKYETISQKSLSQVCECLKNDYKILAKQQGFKFRVIFHPNIWELNINDDIFKDCSRELNKQGIENINLFTNFKSLENPQNYYWQIDTHNNSKGYEFWAKEVYKEWDF